ncbi:MAG: hypothetical protein NTW86_12375 [Candidatus Sumerlaeota bacterium]|nr:hypothetical protein [Candidatus Sumerlaeota bacterium]
MRRIHLIKNPDWRLARRPVKGQAPDWSDSIPSTVPGNVLLDLQRAGLVPDPFYGENFRACQWAGEWTFWYRLVFDAKQLEGLPPAPPEHLRLRFEGIDTFAEIILNGESLGTVHNMFRRHAFDVTDLFRWTGDNELIVRIDPPLQSAREWMKQNGVSTEGLAAVFGYPERPATRKMQMAYGWDNSPVLLAGGLFRDVRLESLSGPALDDVAWCVEDVDAERKRARLVVQGGVEGQWPQGARVQVLGACDEQRFAGETATGRDGAWKLAVDVREARLWWPNGLGAPDQYQTKIRLLDAEGATLDEQSLKIGLRRIEVPAGPIEKRMEHYRIGRPARRQDMDGGGVIGDAWSRILLEKPVEVTVRPLVFHVNGRPVFIKGVDWQTPDALPGRIAPQQTAALLDAARDAHANMIRLWGGGVIEIDEFYEQCSERGLMVWQDFYFACALYPTAEAFLQEIRVEARDMIRRLRNHTCLACWCGDNESDMMNYDRGIDPAKDPINKGALPEALRELDPQKRYYHPSSPGGDDYPRSPWSGDKRNWGGWSPHGNYRFLREEDARFISEAGTYALPARATVDQFMPPDLRWPFANYTWELHNGSVDRMRRNYFERMESYWKFLARPQSLDEAIRISQFGQAWGLKLLIERCRQRKFDCGGVMLWKLNDAWPCADGGLLDYYLRPRLALEWVRRAYQPVAVSMSQDPADPRADVEVWVVNDLHRAMGGMLELRVVEVAENGQAIRTAETRREKIEAPADSAQPYFAVSVAALDPSKTVLVAALQETDGTIESESTFTLEPRVAYLYHS